MSFCETRQSIGRTQFFFFFQAEDGIRDYKVTGVQTCALPIYAEHLGGPPHLLLDLLAGRPARLEREGDVLEHRAVGIEGVALEHHGDPAGSRGHVAVHPLVPDVDLAGRRSLEPRDHAQQGRLPRAGGAEQDEELAVVDRQVHPIDRMEIPEVLSETSDFDASHRRGASSRASARGPWYPAVLPG